jgi:hypothetical protein
MPGRGACPGSSDPVGDFVIFQRRASGKMDPVGPIWITCAWFSLLSGKTGKEVLGR